MLESRGAQQSDAWIRARVGRITGSRLNDVCNYLKRASGDKAAGDSSAKRDRYRLELITERLTGRATDHYTSLPMERGSELEADARIYYERALRVMCEPVGFVLHPLYDFTGASADSLIGDSGVLEIKCPIPVVHIGYVLAGEVPEEYLPQCYWEMACADRQWCDFVSFCPDIQSEKLRFFYRRIDRDEGLIDYYTAEVLKMEAEIQEFMKEHEANPIAPFPVEIKEVKEKKPMSDDPLSDDYAFLDEQEFVP